MQDSNPEVEEHSLEYLHCIECDEFEVQWIIQGIQCDKINLTFCIRRTVIRTAVCV